MLLFRKPNRSFGLSANTRSQGLFRWDHFQQHCIDSRYVWMDEIIFWLIYPFQKFVNPRSFLLPPALVNYRSSQIGCGEWRQVASNSKELIDQGFFVDFPMFCCTLVSNIWMIQNSMHFKVFLQWGGDKETAQPEMVHVLAAAIPKFSWFLFVWENIGPL